MLSLPLVLLSIINEIAAQQSSYSAIPRWGQAVALVEQTLYIHGGRTDPYNAYSYSSAPPNNDLLSLSLASPFDPSAPPFTYLGGCSNCSSSPGPAVASHTLTPLNTTRLLLFGGAAGPNSPSVLPDRNDSAALLALASSPTWAYETASWAAEPLRRIHHAAVPAQGKVWIVGGERADGSGSAFSTHYVFDPAGPAFAPLPTPDAPPDITGHAAAVLPDGRVLVLGGYSPSQQALVPLTTLWVLNTTSLAWSTLSVSPSSVPPPRRNFAATLLGGTLLLHGGADAALQTSLSDGWALDTSASPLTWSPLAALTSLGPRRDHFAISANGLAVFGFGYAQNGPASAEIAVFNLSANAFQTSFTPPTSAPAPSQTSTGHPGSAEYPQPTPSGKGGSPPSNGTGVGSSPGNNNGGGGGNGDGEGDASRNHTTAIALGTAFGVLALLLGGAGATYYVRRRSRGSFHLLSPSDDVAGEGGGGREKGLPVIPVVYTIRERLGRVGRGRERRDMLAEEDTREFERESSWGSNGWFNAPSRQSSRRRPTLERMYDSLASLKNVGGAVLEYAAGRSREPSRASTLERAIWDAKSGAFDPYTDELGRSHYSPPALRASHPRGGSYADPFEDAYEVESLQYDTESVYRDDASEEDSLRGYPYDPPPPPQLAGLRAPASLSLPLQPPPASSASDSSASHDPSQSPRRPPSFISADTGLVKRSNSWWARFAMTPLLERRASTPRPVVIRDPRPPPRLVPISESAPPSPSPSSPASPAPQDRAGARALGTGRHGRSASSLRTADSERLERVATTMVVVQKEGSGSSRRSFGGREPTGEDVLGSPAELVRSPTGMTPAETAAIERPTSSSLVSERVQAYERRAAQQEGSPPVPERKRAGSTYGLVPKSPLFVANPDRRGGSGDS